MQGEQQHERQLHPYVKLLQERQLEQCALFRAQWLSWMFSECEKLPQDIEEKLERAKAALEKSRSGGRTPSGGRLRRELINNILDEWGLAMGGKTTFQS